MSRYTPTSGTITQIDWLDTDPRQIGCGLLSSIF